MSNRFAEVEIHNRPCPNCYLCGFPGRFLYQDSEDRLFGSPGTWNLKQCPNPLCGLAWLDPMPLEDEIWKAYDNYYTHECVERSGWLYQTYCYAKNGYLTQRYGNSASISFWQKLAGALFYLHPMYRERLDLSVMGLRVQAGKRLLDIGCGGGFMLALLHSLGWNAEGVEVDPKAVSQARAQGLRVREGTLADQQYADESIHAITMHHVIEHIHEPKRLLKECYRILEPGGQIVIITPNLASRLHRRFRRNWYALDPPRHLMLFSPPSLGAIVKETGFSISSLTTKARLAPAIYLESRRLASQARANGSKWEWFWANSAFWLEWAGLRFRPDSGEELVLHGEKLAQQDHTASKQSLACGSGNLVK